MLGATFCADSEGSGLRIRHVDLPGLHAERILPTNQVWRSNAELRRFWELYSDSPSPQIDFRNRSVVAVFLGARANTGYSVEITRIDDAQDHQDVHYVELLPNPDRDYAAVVTHPYDAVEVERMLSSARFVGTRLVRKE
jgi:hypothetical protein